MEGEETALKHASGVGLWLVKWFAEVNEGSLEFGDADGTPEVTIHLRRPRD